MSLRFRRRPAVVVLLAVAVGLLVAACGGDGEPTPECLSPEGGVLVPAACEAPGATLEPTPTATTGNGGGDDGGLHPGFLAFRGAGCAGCHTIDGTSAAGRTGPNLTGVAAKGPDYIRQSILTPSEVVAPGFSDGIMPQNFGTVLTADEIDLIVEYLSGL